MWSQAFEEGEELVVGSIATGLSIERSNRVEKPLLQLKVSIQIDLCGLDRLMTEPERNHGLLDTLLQQIHCCRVSEHMWLTRLCFSDGQALVAVATCLANR